MLTEMIDYGHKIEEEVKAMQSEIKKNLQGNNSRVDEPTKQINEEKDNQPEEEGRRI